VNGRHGTNVIKTLVTLSRWSLEWGLFILTAERSATATRTIHSCSPIAAWSELVVRVGPELGIGLLAAPSPAMVWGEKPMCGEWRVRSGENSDRGEDGDRTQSEMVKRVEPFGM
jgi:hypothetical protein